MKLIIAALVFGSTGIAIIVGFCAVIAMAAIIDREEEDRHTRRES
jgi:hypothetical protein